MSSLNITDLWEEYKVILQTGKRTKRALILEPKIHEEQKRLGNPIYDFDKRWAKNEEDRKSTVEGPPMDSRPEATKSVPVANFTVDNAKEIIGKNDCALLEECARKAEARMIYLAYILEQINPDNKKNMARRGQATNIANFIFIEEKKK